jgi:hypothetical protein
LVGWLVANKCNAYNEFSNDVQLHFLIVFWFAGHHTGWHRCMSLEEHGVSDEICAEQNLDLMCINPRNQLWDNTHGDW